MAEPQQRFSLITDKNLADLRKLVGVPIEDSLEPWCYEATRDNIRHWAHGIGDDNPLWCDPAYAAKRVRTHRRTALVHLPAQSLVQRIRGRPAGRARDVRRNRCRSGIKPMLLGDQFTTKVWLKELVEHQTRFAGRVDPADLSLRILQSERRDWWPRAIAGAFAPSATPRASAAPSTTRSRKKQPVYYSRDDLAKIFALYEAEEIRGAESALYRRREGWRQAADDGRRGR